MSVTILYAKIQLPNGSFAIGPVTTQDYQEFLFRNTGSDLDLYFRLKRNDGGWYFSGGPGIEIPSSLIDQVGRQIDQEIVVKH